MRSRSMVRSLPCLRQLLCLGPAASVQPGGNGEAPSCRAAGWGLDGNPISAPSSVRAGESLPLCLSSNLCTCNKKQQQVNTRKRLPMDVQNTLLFRTTTVWHTCSTHKAHRHPIPSPSPSLPLYPSQCSATRPAFFLPSSRACIRENAITRSCVLLLFLLYNFVGRILT
jgi:hypothetical protein